MRLLSRQIDIIVNSTLEEMRQLFNRKPTEEEQKEIDEKFNEKYPYFQEMTDTLFRLIDKARKESDAVLDFVDEMKKDESKRTLMYNFPRVQDNNFEQMKKYLEMFEKRVKLNLSVDLGYRKELNKDSVKSVIYNIVYMADTRRKEMKDILQDVIQETKEKISPEIENHYFRKGDYIII